jgi:hypothetical protein
VTSIDSFIGFAIAAGKKFGACRKDLGSPFLHSYPRNCCEFVSVHLGLVLENANPGKDVQIVRAYNRGTDEWHYWVEMESLVFDLTAHQFEAYRGPIVCAKPNPLEIRFPDIERISTSKARLSAKFETNPQIERILAVFTS